PGATWVLFLASLTAAAQVSRLITEEPIAVAPAKVAPVTAVAPRNPRRLKPVFSFSSSVVVFLSLMTDTSPWLGVLIWTELRRSFQLDGRNNLWLLSGRGFSTLAPFFARH